MKYHKLESESQTPSKNKSNKLRIVQFLVLLFVGLLLLCGFLITWETGFRPLMYQPRVRKRNRKPVNPYGIEGQQRLPHAIIIGVRKAGTRALLDFLNLHPDVRVAAGECHFFAQDANYYQGLEFYRKQMPFSKPHQLTIEKTPNYFHKGYLAAERIHDMNSSVKIIVVLREPAARAVSDYLQFYQMKGGKKSFEELAIDAKGRVNGKFGAIERSAYYKILKKYWLEYFPKSQILVVNGDALGRENPGNEMKLVQQFLGLRQIVDENMFVFDKQKHFYCVKSEERQEGCLSNSKGRKHPPQSEQVMKQLRRYFKPYNQKLFKFIGRDLGWNS